jgi:hypothetical protein
MRGSKSSSPTSRPCALTPSSTRPIHRWTRSRRRMPYASWLHDRPGKDHQGLSAARQARDPYRWPGVEWREARPGCSACIVLSAFDAALRRARACVGGLPCDFHRDLPFPRGSRGGNRRSNGRGRPAIRPRCHTGDLLLLRGSKRRAASGGPGRLWEPLCLMIPPLHFPVISGEGQTECIHFV